MRGRDHRNDTLFSYVRPDSRIPENHPLRAIRVITDTALKSLSGRFDALYSVIGRPSIPPEKLLRALLLQAFYSIRSERQLMAVWIDDPHCELQDPLGGCATSSGRLLISKGAPEVIIGLCDRWIDGGGVAPMAEVQRQWPEDLDAFEFIVRRCRQGADRHRPADADRAYRNLVELRDAILGGTPTTT